MSELVDHLAELTGFRDRDILDVTLVGALRERTRRAEAERAALDAEAQMRRIIQRVKGSERVYAMAPATGSASAGCHPVSSRNSAT